MKILFIGDSIVKGSLGVSFVNIVSTKITNSKIKNLGVNGETLNIISKRLLNHLRKVNDYDYLVINGGGNDIGIPAFLEKGILFKFAYWVQIKKGMLPTTDSINYYNNFKKLICETKKLFKGQIILLTYGCISEKLDTGLNKQLQEYNQKIRLIVEEEKILLADAETLIHDFLKNKIQTNYFCESFWAVTYFDPIISLFKNGAGYLSKKRDLFVTIDGIHLNNKGAELVSESIIEILKKK